MAGHIQARLLLNMRRILDEKGLNQSRLSERMGVSRAYISNIMHGRSVLGLDVVERLADALDIDAADLFEPEKIPV